LLNDTCLKEQGATFSYVSAMIVPAKSAEITEIFSAPLRALAQPAVELYSMLNDELGGELFPIISFPPSFSFHIRRILLGTYIAPIGDGASVL